LILTGEVLHWCKGDAYWFQYLPGVLVSLSAAFCVS
jgi:hypothetical protein